MKIVTLAFPEDGIELSDDQLKNVLFAALACYAEYGAGGKKRAVAARAMYKAAQKATVFDGDDPRVGARVCDILPLT